MSYPANIDNLTNPQTSDPMNSPSHAGQHGAVNDAVEAIETALGITTNPREHSATEKTTPADADELGLIDSAASWVLKKLTWANLKAAVSGGMNNLLKNGNFINNSTNGYGSTPDDWVNSNANPVQGGFPSMTKAELIALLGIADGDIEGLWNLNEASGNATDLSSNAYHLTDTNTVLSSDDGLMGKARDFELDNSECFTIADASCANLEIAGSQTWIAFFKPEALTANHDILRKQGAGAIKTLTINTGVNKVQFRLDGLTTAESVISDIVVEAGKWYMAVGVYDSVNSLIKIWVNGVKKQTTASGSATDTDGDFAIGRAGGVASQFFDGLIQNSIIINGALTDSQVKKLFAATLYRGQKIRRATTNAYLSQALPEDLVERLRGKDVSIVAKAYQDTASTAQISIDDGTEIASATSATTGSWIDIGILKTISATATAITLKIKHSTSDGNSWFKEVAFYEGGSLVYVWYPSYDDIARFPRLLALNPPASPNGYSFEEKRWYTWTPIYTGGGTLTYGTVTTYKARYKIIEDTCYWGIESTGTVATSNSTWILITAPISRLYTTAYETAGTGRGVNNAVVFLASVAWYNTSQTIIGFERSTALGNWTDGAGREIRGAGFYEIV